MRYSPRKHGLSPGFSSTWLKLTHDTEKKNMKFDRFLKIAALAILPAIVFLGGCPAKKAEEAKKEEPKAEVKKEAPKAEAKKEEPKAEPTAISKALSCLNKKLSSCIDYSEGFNSEEAKILCGATVESEFRIGEACPTENRIGTCEEEYHNHKFSYRFYSPFWNLEKAKKECGDDIKRRDDLIGKFVEG